jgi:hypothetical protein
LHNITNLGIIISIRGEIEANWFNRVSRGDGEKAHKAAGLQRNTAGSKEKLSPKKLRLFSSKDRRLEGVMNNPSDSLKQVESYAFTLAVLDSMEDLIVVVGCNGTVINANDAWKRFAQDHGASSPVTRAVGMKYEDLCWWAGGDHSADVR